MSGRAKYGDDPKIVNECKPGDIMPNAQRVLGKEGIDRDRKPIGGTLEN
jgi:hypothetical protein